MNINMLKVKTATSVTVNNSKEIKRERKPLDYIL